MNQRIRRSFITTGALTVAVAVAGLITPRTSAAQTGSISGKVTDRNSKQPIEQAQVTVQGTSYGIYTKANGTYTILGVPPGTYTVTAKRVGYQSVDAMNVTVRIDISRNQDFELSSAGYGELIPLAPTQTRSAPAYASATGAQVGPGSVFGIDAYECANCGVARFRDSTHAVYTFGAEPVVVSVSPNVRDRIRPGDVIVAVNGNPITTRAGADLFAYPDSGEVRLTLRRNGTNIDVMAYSLNVVRPMLTDPVLRASAGGRGGAAAGAVGGGGGGGAGRGGRGGAGGFARSPTGADSALRERVAATLCAVGSQRGSDSATVRTFTRCPPDSLRAELQRAAGVAGGVADSARRTTGAVAGGRGGIGGGRAGAAVLAPGSIATTDVVVSSTVELRNYGFTLSCRPDCTRMRSRAGVLYWKFDGYPTVAVQSLAKDGLAAKAGIREGDVLISVNGFSPLSEEGAVLLNRSDRELELIVELSRGGKREKYTLKL